MDKKRAHEIEKKGSWNRKWFQIKKNMAHFVKWFEIEKTYQWQNRWTNLWKNRWKESMEKSVDKTVKKSVKKSVESWGNQRVWRTYLHLSWVGAWQALLAHLKIYLDAVTQRYFSKALVKCAKVLRNLFASDQLFINFCFQITTKMPGPKTSSGTFCLYGGPLRPVVPHIEDDERVTSSRGIAGWTL